MNLENSDAPLTQNPSLFIKSLQPFGLQCRNIEIEAISVKGLQKLSLSGLPDAWLKDSKDKLVFLIQSHSEWSPFKKILVHLLPSDVQKSGSHLELPILLAAILSLESAQLSPESRSLLEKYSFAASVDLDGNLFSSKQETLWEKSAHLTLGAGQFSNLKELLNFIRQGKDQTFEFSNDSPTHSHFPENPAPQVEGRCWEKFTLLVAAIAQVPVMLIGPPGTGKSTLAKWAKKLLPEPQAEDARLVEQVWSLAEKERSSRVPYIAPHSRSHISEFLGTQSGKTPRPGYFSLAHKGLLVLDEFPELARDCREILRVVLDNKKVLKSSREGHVEWPAHFWLIATANPCPCGYLAPGIRNKCACSQQQIQNYISRFSGPLYDRMGMVLFVDLQQSAVSKRIESLVESLDTNFIDWIPLKRKQLEEKLSEASELLESRAFSETYNRRNFEISKRLLAALLTLFPDDPDFCWGLCSHWQKSKQNLLRSLGNPL